jgi:hypothetical protein
MNGNFLLVSHEQDEDLVLVLVQQLLLPVLHPALVQDPLVLSQEHGQEMKTFSEGWERPMKQPSVKPNHNRNPKSVNEWIRFSVWERSNSEEPLLLPHLDLEQE